MVPSSLPLICSLSSSVLPCPIYAAPHRLPPKSLPSSFPAWISCVVRLAMAVLDFSRQPCWAPSSLGSKHATSRPLRVKSVAFGRRRMDLFCRTILKLNQRVLIKAGVSLALPSYANVELWSLVTAICTRVKRRVVWQPCPLAEWTAFSTCK